MRSATCPADWEQLNNVSRSARRAIQGCVVKGCSSVGRAAVSKTAGRGFEPLCPCQHAVWSRKSVAGSRECENKNTFFSCVNEKR